MNIRHGCIKMFDHYYQEDYLRNIAKVSGSSLSIYFVDDFLIPIFRKRGELGTVINSSPFFGSHGGFRKSDSSHFETFERIAFHELAGLLVEPNVSAITLVDNPYQSLEELEMNCLLQRTISELCDWQCLTTKRHSAALRLEFVADEDALKTNYHQKTRNCLKKFEKSGAEVVSLSSSDVEYKDTIEWIAAKHIDTIKAKNGVFKNTQYFRNLNADFADDRFGLKLCLLNGERVGGVLNFHWEKQREYWTPVVTEEGRKINALYGLIHQTARDVVGGDGSLLNFGGCWPDQLDLLRFKQRFGSEVREYQYHTYLATDAICEAEPEELRKQYPYFYVRPYS